MELYTRNTLPSPAHTRILIVQPGAFDDQDIYCQLEAVLREKNSDYFALSYSWGLQNGDTSLSSKIHVSGQSVPVTRNLYDGLRRIRDQSRPLRIWVDAVCINQSSVEERNAHIVDMAKIYQNATKVLVWLGEGKSEAEDRDMLTILQWSEIEYGQHHRITSRALNGRTVDVPAVFEWRFPDKRTTVDERAQVLAASDSLRCDFIEVGRTLSAFCARRYFRRRWIVQELYHSTDTIDFYWGPCKYPILWSLRDRMLSPGMPEPFTPHLESWAWVAATAFAALPKAAPEHVNMFHEVECRLDRIAKLDRGGNFISALAEFADLECLDDRDILFALSSLDPGFGLLPDYTLDLAQTCIMFARIMVERGLLDRMFDQCHPSNLEMPSWVPDIRRLKFFHGAYIPEAPAPGTFVDSEDILVCPLLLHGILMDVWSDDSMDTAHTFSISSSEAVDVEWAVWGGHADLSQVDRGDSAWSCDVNAGRYGNGATIIFLRAVGTGSNLCEVVQVVEAVRHNRDIEDPWLLTKKTVRIT